MRRDLYYVLKLIKCSYVGQDLVRVFLGKETLVPRSVRKCIV